MECGRGEIGIHVGLRSRCASVGVQVSPPAPSQSFSDFWGIRFVGDHDGQRKIFVANWIRVMRKDSDFADKIQNDHLLESDLFEARRQCSTIIAVIKHKMEFYRTLPCA